MAPLKTGIEPSHATPVGAYVHLPFCRQKCTYCDFFTVQSGTSTTRAYVDALIAEIAHAAERHDGTALDTVYLGGGTPSLTPPAELERLLAALDRGFGVAAGAELDLEVDPGDYRRDDLRALRALGVDRLSLGVQALDDDLLALLGRAHRRPEALDLLDDARAAGFDNVSVDLIFGVPGDDEDRWYAQLEEILAREPAHLSCYELTFEPGTWMAREAGRLAPPDEDERHALFLGTSERLAARGFIHYEVSSHARGAAARSRHNMRYWRQHRYLGFGASAHSFDGRRRWWNRRSLRRYLEAPTDAVEGEEVLDEADLADEHLMLGLRFHEGVDLERSGLGSRLAADPRLAAHLARLEDEGHLARTPTRLVPTPAGMAIADALARLLVA